jgi:hypothetical protein
VWGVQAEEGHLFQLFPLFFSFFGLNLGRMSSDAQGKNTAGWAKSKRDGDAGRPSNPLTFIITIW